MESGGTGNAGGIVIGTGSLSLSNSGQLQTLVRGPSEDGLTAGGVGDAGRVIVLADDDVSLTNNGAILSNVQAGASGDAGGIGIRARSLFIKEDSRVNVSNFELGEGEAGAIIIETREDIVLINEGRISAVALSGNGGNIELDSGDFLLVLAGSNVSTTSGSLGAPGEGGDIDVETRFVIAAPYNDNNFSAQAYGDDGGRINITASRIVDLEERDDDFLISNDITASSPFGLGRDGIVTTSELSPDPTAGLANLPVSPIDPSSLIAETCAPRTGVESEPNKFTITGRGGLPPDPNAAFPGEAVVTDLSPPDPATEDDPSSANPTNPNLAQPTPPQEPKLVEAQGWVYGKNGEVILTAQATTITPTQPTLTSATTCNAN